MWSLWVRVSLVCGTFQLGHEGTFRLVCRLAKCLMCGGLGAA